MASVNQTLHGLFLSSITGCYFFKKGQLTGDINQTKYGLKNIKPLMKEADFFIYVWPLREVRKYISIHDLLV